MTTLIKIIATSALFGLTMFSCNFSVNTNPRSLDGKGEVITKTHALQDDFSKIFVENGWNIVLIQKKQSPKLVVTANKNLHGVLEFAVQNNSLHIFSDKNIDEADAKTIKIYYNQDLLEIKASSGTAVFSNEKINQEQVTLSISSGAEMELKYKVNTMKIEASSGADIETEVQADKIFVNTSSGSEVNLSGKTTNLSLNASSGSEINAKSLISKTASADASSAAEITLNVTDDFTGNASSASHIYFHGNPEKVNIETGSAGDISQK